MKATCYPNNFINVANAAAKFEERPIHTCLNQNIQHSYKYVSLHVVAPFISKQTKFSKDKFNTSSSLINLFILFEKHLMR